MNIVIDESSGFCFGVVRAITTAEEELSKQEELYCLGDIVHNGQEVNRLANIGLKTINHEMMHNLHHSRVLLRAHGEPPSTYALAQRNNIKIVDATCPVVLQLQKKIKQAYEQNHEAQIVIFGKIGHAEVIGLEGQTANSAIVIENIEDIKKLDFNRPIILFSQTTKSIEKFNEIVATLKAQSHSTFEYHDTICRQVANRIPNIKQFATQHDLILFVSGKKSSNGKVLYAECKSVNPRTEMISAPDEIEEKWLDGAKSVGICGATSTPKWLMEEVAKKIKTIDPK